jgi:hypothetical protein
MMTEDDNKRLSYDTEHATALPHGERFPELAQLRQELYERPKTYTARIRRFFSQVEVAPIETVLFFVSLYWGASLTGDDRVFDLLPSFRYFRDLPFTENQQGWFIVFLSLFTLFATSNKKWSGVRLFALMCQVFLWAFIGSTIFRAIHYAPPMGMYFCLFFMSVYAFVRLSFDVADVQSARRALRHLYFLNTPTPDSLPSTDDETP